MKKIKDLKGLFLEQLKDRYNAAEQQAELYPKLAAAATHAELKKIIYDDIEANKNHLKKLQTFFKQMGEEAGGEECEGTQGLIHEAHELLTMRIQK